MNRLSLLTFLAFALLAVGCSSGRLVTYNTTINSVERPTDAKERYGEYTVTRKDTGYVYEDDLIRAVFVSGGSQVVATVKNRTEHSIQILPEQGAFVLPSGTSDRILLGDMSYMNRNQKVQPITVPSGATSAATFIPESKVSMGQYGPVVDPIFSPGTVGGMGQAKTTTRDVRQNIGKTFSLLLPIKIQDTVNEYTFTFKVSGAKIEGGRKQPSQTVGDYPETQ